MDQNWQHRKGQETLLNAYNHVLADVFDNFFDAEPGIVVNI